MTWPAPAKVLKDRTHCIHGHRFDEENTIRGDDGWRRCRECRRVRVLAYYYRTKAKAA